MGTIYKSGIEYSGSMGLPDGGVTGQALVKASDVDQDVEWGDVQGSGVPEGGNAGEIIIKNSSDDGDASWGVNTGAELVKYGRQYGMMPSTTPIKQVIATDIGEGLDGNVSRKWRIPTGGVLTNVNSFLSGVTNTFDVYLTIDGYTERKVMDAPHSASGGYLADIDNTDLNWYIRNDIAVENGNLTFSAYAHEGAAFGVNKRINQIRLVAKGDNTFGTSDGTKPYDIRNLTGMVLDDLKITGNAIPTDWGVAESGVIKVRNVTPTVSGEYRWDLSGYGFTNTGDYNIFVDIVGGTGGFADAIWSFVKRTDSASIYAKGATASVTEIDFAYVLVAKGYGNNRMGGGAGLPSGGTTGQVLSKASNADGDVTWRTPSGGSGLAPEMTWDDQQDLMGLANGNNVLSFRDTGDGVNVGITRPGEYLGGGELAKKGYVDTELATKQDELVSGANIKTVNGNSLLGSGDIQISGSGVPSYEVSNNDSGGNVVKVGEYVENGVTYGIYEFYYKTGALPNTTTKVFSLATLLADYTILDFMDAHGITSNGICIGSGRLDGTNIIVVQQFSKNNKTFTVRSYQDFSGATARVCIKFIGTKNA